MYEKKYATHLKWSYIFLIDRGRGRGSNGRSFSHSSMELLTGRNYFSGSDGELEVAENDLVYTQGPPNSINPQAPLQNQGDFYLATFFVSRVYVLILLFLIF